MPRTRRILFLRFCLCDQSWGVRVDRMEPNEGVGGLGRTLIRASAAVGAPDWDFARQFRALPYRTPMLVRSCFISETGLSRLYAAAAVIISCRSHRFGGINITELDPSPEAPAADILGKAYCRGNQPTMIGPVRANSIPSRPTQTSLGALKMLSLRSRFPGTSG